MTSSGVRALAYIGIETSLVDEWAQFCTSVLGMQRSDEGDEQDWIGLRVDERSFRLGLHRSGSEGLAYVGWEVADEGELERVRAKVKEHGIDVAEGGRAHADARRVRSLISFKDPAGNSTEVCCGPRLSRSVFTPGAAGVGFVAGELGLGHVVVSADPYGASLDFYQDVLGFRTSDVYEKCPGETTFLRCNGRHHSLALADAGATALRHIMVEVDSVDAVGLALERCAQQGVPITRSLGRHSNDGMLSAYLQTPSGFEVEYGFGGRLVDDATWVVTEIRSPSVWGHWRPPLEGGGGPIGILVPGGNGKRPSGPSEGGAPSG